MTTFMRMPKDEPLSEQPFVGFKPTQDFLEWAAKGMEVKAAKNKRRYLRIWPGDTVWADGPRVRRFMFGDK